MIEKYYPVGRCTEGDSPVIEALHKFRDYPNGIPKSRSKED